MKQRFMFQGNWTYLMQKSRDKKTTLRELHWESPKVNVWCGIIFRPMDWKEWANSISNKFARYNSLRLLLMRLCKRNYISNGTLLAWSKGFVMPLSLLMRQFYREIEYHLDVLRATKDDLIEIYYIQLIVT